MLGELDSWTVESGGIRFRFDLDSDYEANRDDLRANDEGMRDETVAAHGRGEWEYVGVTVTPLVDGLDTGEFSYVSAQLWGVEFGDLPATSAAGIPEDDFRYGPDSEAVSVGRDEIAGTYPGPDMIAEVRVNLARLRDALAALDLGDAS